MSNLDRAAIRRVNRAVETAKKAATDRQLQDIHLRRFHRAMDDLESREEGEAVYDQLRSEGWYEMAARALSKAGRS
jgi:hypothetical protein